MESETILHAGEKAYRRATAPSVDLLYLRIKLIHRSVQHHIQETPNAAHQEVTKDKPQEKGNCASVAPDPAVFEDGPLQKKANQHGYPEVRYLLI